MGELWEAQGQLWEALAELREALGELWEGLYIQKLPINRPSGRYVIMYVCVLDWPRQDPWHSPKLSRPGPSRIPEIPFSKKNTVV